MDGLCKTCRGEPRKGANFNIQESTIWAAGNGHFECLKQLLKNGADVNLVERGTSALCEASSKGHTECVSLLIDAGADVNFRKEESGETCLMEGAGSGDCSCMMTLLNAGADVNMADECGYTSLMMAARSGNSESVKALLNAGVDVNAETNEDYDHVTALTMAVAQNHETCAELLIDAGARLEGNPNGGYIPLEIAASRDAFNCLKLLIKSGADLNAENTNSGDSALRTACQKGYVQIAEELIRAGADVNFIGSYHEPIISSTAFVAQDECLSLLLKAGADVNSCNNNRETALMRTPHRSALICMQLLIEAGADVNWRDHRGLTPLIHSASVGYAAGISLLLQANAKINILCNEGRNALERNIMKKEFYAGRFYRKPKIKGVKFRKDDELSDSDVEKLMQEAPMMLMAAGEVVPKSPLKVEQRGGPLIVPIPDYLMPDPDLKLCLRHLCRKAIRTHLLNLDPHHHLFDRIPKLGLPPRMSRYLLFDIDLTGNNNPDD